MNTNIKIFLTINLEGSTLVRKSIPEQINYTIRKKDLYSNIGKNLPKEIAETIASQGTTPHFGLEAKPAKLHINICQASYEFMQSDFCPQNNLLKTWLKMTPNERLEYHLDRLCLHHRGYSYSYEVLDN